MTIFVPLCDICSIVTRAHEGIQTTGSLDTIAMVDYRYSIVDAIPTSVTRASAVGHTEIVTGAPFFRFLRQSAVNWSYWYQASWCVFWCSTWEPDYGWVMVLFLYCGSRLSGPISLGAVLTIKYKSYSCRDRSLVIHPPLSL